MLGFHPSGTGGLTVRGELSGEEDLEMEYKYLKQTGALREAMGTETVPEYMSPEQMRESPAQAHDQDERLRRERAARAHFHPEWAQATPHPRPAVDPTSQPGRHTVFSYVVEEGQRALMVLPDGRLKVIVGPSRVASWRRRFEPMKHFVAHPGEFLIVRYRDGRQEHLPGPADIWFDPRDHLSVEKEDALQIGSKEAVVVYSRGVDAEVSRRIVNGPATFVPQPGEWLHTFAWHGAAGGSKGYRKVPRGLVFQKLWLMPDQMYHDVPDVRTADDAVVTIKLMVFFELTDIERMLETTHDPIGDFVNAATSDIVEFVGKHDFDAFKRSTEKLNDLEAYKTLVTRAEQCGYRINKVVYRGYGATKSLQQMHDQAIEARTRLQLEKATEEQAQELEDFKLDRQLARSAKQRGESEKEVELEIDTQRKRHEAQLQSEEARRTLRREQAKLDAEQEEAITSARDALRRNHLGALKDLGVNLTRFLTQGRADQVIELRGSKKGEAHVHLDGRVDPSPES